jgi:hypothetical protein
MWSIRFFVAVGCIFYGFVNLCGCAFLFGTTIVPREHMGELEDSAFQPKYGGSITRTVFL